MTSTSKTAGEVALELFLELSRVYRPSFEEEAMRTHIAAVVAQARPRWSAKAPTLTRDAAGNLLICVPGTGRFLEAPPVAMQGHMDMVMEHVDNDIGGDPRRFFKDGVVTELVTIDGVMWMRSAGERSTLGADNGVFDAIALRYVVDPTLEHPPLELVFTAAEERGLVGARALTLPITAKVLLNLDSEIEGTVTRGCQGSQRRILSGHAEVSPAEADTVTWRLTDLIGGHSGLEIHRPRANAIKVIATILEESRDVRLVSAMAGGEGALNKIANSCVVTVSLPRQSDATARARARLVELTATLTDETGPRLEERKSEQAGVAFTRAATQRLARALLDAANGVLESDVALPNHIRTSSNLGLWQAQAHDGTLRIGFMTRSFSNTALEVQASAIQRTLTSAFADEPARTGETSPAWMVGPDDPLVRLALAEPKLFTHDEVTPAGIETGPIVERYPGMRAISIGPTIERVHTVHERLDVGSLHRFVDVVQALLVRIGAQARV